MKQPPYNLLKAWFELYENEFCEESYLHAIDMLERHYGTVENAVCELNDQSTQIVMSSVFSSFL